MKNYNPEDNKLNGLAEIIKKNIQSKYTKENLTRITSRRNNTNNRPEIKDKDDK